MWIRLLIFVLFAGLSVGTFFEGRETYRILTQGEVRTGIVLGTRYYRSEDTGRWPRFPYAPEIVVLDENADAPVFINEQGYTRHPIYEPGEEVPVRILDGEPYLATFHTLWREPVGFALGALFFAMGVWLPWLVRWINYRRRESLKVRGLKGEATYVDTVLLTESGFVNTYQIIAVGEHTVTREEQVFKSQLLYQDPRKTHNLKPAETKIAIWFNRERPKRYVFDLADLS